MKKGDLVFFYHSNEGKEIVGLTKVVKEFYLFNNPEVQEFKFFDSKVSFIHPISPPLFELFEILNL